MCILLGDRSELQRNCCRSVWCSVNGTRKRNGEKVALGRTELEIGIAISVRNDSVALSDLVHPLLRIIFEFTIKEMKTKCGTSDGELILLGPGVCTMSADCLSTAFACVPPPSSSRYENLICQCHSQSKEHFEYLQF